MKVTVLMSVYNETMQELKAAIESILNQTYKDFEFLIINDGQDSTIVDVINEYKDNRIRLINNDKNIGLAASLNKGLELAKGYYIVRMDADDIAYKNRIEEQLKFIETHQEYAIVSSRAEVFDEHGTYAKTKICGEILKEELIRGTKFIHPTMIIDRKVLKEIGGYPNYRRAQDYAMIMNLYSYGYKGYVMDEILLKYKMDKNGYKKKKFKYRIMESQIRAKYYKKMKVQWYNYIYVIKPIIVGIIPKKILKEYHQRKMNRGKNDRI